MEIKPEIIKEIAGELEMGMLCFYNKNTGEMESYPDEIDIAYDEENPWEDTINKVEENQDDYISFEAMNSRDAFRVMEGYTNSIHDLRTCSRFLNALSRKKPFANFSNLFDYYPDLREPWFAYKGERYIEFVKEQIENPNSLS